MLEEAIGVASRDISLHNDVFGVTAKRHTIKETMTFLLGKRNNKMKSKPSEWEKMFALYELNKGLRSRMHKELRKLNNNPARKQVKNIKQTLTRGHANGQQTNEQVVQLTNHQRNTNDNYNMVSSLVRIEIF